MTPLLDTHVVLWWLAGGDRLSDRARATIESAEQLYVSSISLWEVGTLQRHGRIALDRPPRRWASDLLADPKVDLAPLPPDAAISAGAELGDDFPGDPADRLIYSTARSLRIPLVSKDDRLHAYGEGSGDVDVVW